MKANTKKLVLSAILIAMSFVLAHFKVFDTVAFDSLPAFLGVLILGNAYGAAIGAMGHLFTAMLSGFPRGLPIHLIIAAFMALTMILFSITYKAVKKKTNNTVIASIFAAIVGTIINGPGSVLALRPILLPMMGAETLRILLVALTITALANAVLALIAYPLLVSAKVTEKFE